MRALGVLLRWWLHHPWRAFWLTVPVFYVGIFALALTVHPSVPMTVGKVFVLGHAVTRYSVHMGRLPAP